MVSNKTRNGVAGIFTPARGSANLAVSAALGGGNGCTGLEGTGTIGGGGVRASLGEEMATPSLVLRTNLGSETPSLVLWARFGSGGGGTATGPVEAMESGAGVGCSGAATGTNFASILYAAKGMGVLCFSVGEGALNVLLGAMSGNLSAVPDLLARAGEPPVRVATNHTPSVSATPAMPLPNKISHFFHATAASAGADATHATGGGTTGDADGDRAAAVAA